MQEWAQQLHSKPNPKLFVDIRNFCWFQLHSKYFPDFLGQLIKKNYFDNVNVHYKNKFVISLAENLVQLRYGSKFRNGFIKFAVTDHLYA
jgi:hypothetical protein